MVKLGIGIFKEVAETHGILKTPELTNIGSFEKCWKFHRDCKTIT